MLRDEWWGFEIGGIEDGRLSYESLFDPSNPPRPIEMAPAKSSARPPDTTTFAFP